MTSGSASVIGSTSASTNASGIATFTSLGISGTVGSYTLTFKSTGLTDAVSSAANLTAGAAAKLRIDQQPSAISSSGQPFAAQPVIQLLDAQNNVVTTAGVNVTATLNGAGGTLNGAAAVPTNASGIAGYANLGITGAGSYTITFSATGLTGVTSGGITVLPFFDSQVSVDSQVSIDSRAGGGHWDWPIATGHATSSLSGTRSVAGHTLDWQRSPS